MFSTGNSTLDLRLPPSPLLEAVEGRDITSTPPTVMLEVVEAVVEPEVILNRGETFRQITTAEEGEEVEEEEDVGETTEDPGIECELQPSISHSHHYIYSLVCKEFCADTMKLNPETQSHNLFLFY